MLAHVAGSVSTDLNVWERMANPCVSQADLPFSNYCVSSLAAGLEFIFTLCVSPCPGILILDVVQTRSFLDWSHTGAFDFSRLCLYQHWSWGQGGELVESNSSFGKYCDPGDSWVYLLSVNMIQKKRCMIFDSGMMTHEESHALRWLKNGTLC